MKKISVYIISICLGLLSIGQTAPIDINTASAAAIVENLSNIGPVKAEAIIEYRQKNGPFQSTSDLLKVKGIGEKTIADNREKILFNLQQIEEEGKTNQKNAVKNTTETTTETPLDETIQSTTADK